VFIYKNALPNTHVNSQQKTHPNIPFHNLYPIRTSPSLRFSLLEFPPHQSNFSQKTFPYKLLQKILTTRILLFFRPLPLLQSRTNFKSMSSHRITNLFYLSDAHTNQMIHSCNILTFGPNIMFGWSYAYYQEVYFETVHAEQRILYQIHTIQFILIHTMSSSYSVLPPSSPYLVHSSADGLSYLTHLLQYCICLLKLFNTMYFSNRLLHTRTLQIPYITYPTLTSYNIKKHIHNFISNLHFNIHSILHAFFISLRGKQMDKFVKPTYITSVNCSNIANAAFLHFINHTTPITYLQHSSHIYIYIHPIPFKHPIRKH